MIYASFSGDGSHMMILVLYLQTPCWESRVIYASFSGDGSHMMILVCTNYRHHVGTPV